MCPLTSLARAPCQTAGLQVTAQQLNSLLNVYASVGDVPGSEKVFRLIGKAFSKTDAYAESMLIKAFVRAGRIEEAFDMAKRSSHVNEVMMATLIGGLVAAKQGHLAARIYGVLHQGKFVPNSTLLDKLLLCCEQSHNGAWALQLIKEAEQNGVPLDAAHFAGAIGAVSQMPSALSHAFSWLELDDPR